MAKNIRLVMKILINTPNYKLPQSGGVANHYAGLLSYWTERVNYNIVGSRNKAGSGKYWLIWDVLKYIVKIIFFAPNIIVLNPSLASNALKRDSIFLNIALVFRKKVVVFFHGFNVYYAKDINGNDFVKKFNKATAFIVLSSNARDILKKWGITKRIYLSTTKVDDSLIKDFNICIRKGNILNLLYLARVEKEKGIFIALDIFKLLSEKYPHLRYTVVGGGTALVNAKKYAEEKKINVLFTGSLSGYELMKSFEKSDLYIFTSYHEGMPTSVLEAMTFGLPVITRPVGGLVDFFENGKMGEMVDSFDAVDFVSPIEKLLFNSSLSKQISLYNHQYGMAHFQASNVVKKMENILLDIYITSY